MTAPAAPFDTMEQQAEAARLGTLVFLASEVLLFAGLFTLWASYRATYTEEFRAAARATDAGLGFADTIVLLCASYVAASAVHAFRGRQAARAAVELAGASGLAVAFLVLKVSEWISHLHHGLAPDGHAGRGTQLFWTLYYASTGLHAVHATVGAVVLLTLSGLVASGRIPHDRAYVVENGVAYWHLVDAIWLLLWPMFYLMRGGG